jgi:hypothetical protein
VSAQDPALARVYRAERLTRELWPEVARQLGDDGGEHGTRTLRVAIARALLDLLERQVIA